MLAAEEDFLGLDGANCQTLAVLAQLGDYLLAIYRQLVLRYHQLVKGFTY